MKLGPLAAAVVTGLAMARPSLGEVVRTPNQLAGEKPPIRIWSVVMSCAAHQRQSIVDIWLAVGCHAGPIADAVKEMAWPAIFKDEDNRKKRRNALRTDGWGGVFVSGWCQDAPTVLSTREGFTTYRLATCVYDPDDLPADPVTAAWLPWMPWAAIPGLVAALTVSIRRRRATLRREDLVNDDGPKSKGSTEVEQRKASAMRYAFISYSTQDAAIAADIAAALESRSVRAFFAPISIEAGRGFVDEINAALRDCDAAVVVWSKHADSSPWVRREIATLTDKSISSAAFPLHIVALDNTRVPEILRTTQRIALDGLGAPEVINRILGTSAATRPSAVRRPVDAMALPDTDLRRLAALLVKAGTDVGAKAAPGALRWRGSDGGQITAEIDVGFLQTNPNSLARIRSAVNILSIHERTSDFYREKKAGPEGAVLPFDIALDQRKQEAAQEMAMLRDLLRPCIARAWTYPEVTP